MRVLVVLSHLPLPEGGAAARVGVGLLKGLRAHGLEVLAIAPGGTERAPAELAVETVDRFDPGRWHGRWIRYAEPHGMLAHGAFAARVRELARGVDAVHLDEVQAAVLARRLDAPVVAHLHFTARRDRDFPPPWTHEGRVHLEAVRAEARARRFNRHVLVNSHEVAADQRARGVRDLTVAPLALDPAAYAPAASAQPTVAGLIGTAHWPPTSNAVRRLLDRIWPLVTARRPGSELRLAGRGMDAAAFGPAAAQPGVTWLGEVPSATGFLRELGVLAYPLGRGSGTKVKVLEALALGLPVVTTPSGAEGIVANDGVIVTDDDERIAAALTALLDDQDERRRRGAAAAQAFAAAHAPLPATAPIVELYERIARRPVLRSGVPARR